MFAFPSDALRPHETHITPESTILLTIDVEDWFQVENFKSVIPYSSWPSRELRVERNVHTILDLLDGRGAKSKGQGAESIEQRAGSKEQRARSKGQGAGGKEQEEEGEQKSLTIENTPGPTPSAQCSLPNTLCPMPHAPCHPNRGLKATFFVLGWIAERLPHLVREIDARGHEVASHGFHHRLCTQCDPGELADDLKQSRELLEDLIGRPVYGYRAPSFGVDDGVLRLVQEAGYQYDSSYNSSSLNSRYGKITLSENGGRGVVHKLAGDFYELPISNLNWGNRVIPLGGGGYFRLIPLEFFLKGVKKILKEKKVYLFYFHPWEIDPGQPRVKNAPLSFRFRHYCNLNKTLGRLTNLIARFGNCRFNTCYQYLQEHKKNL